MLDNQLIQAFLPIVNTGLNNLGITGVIVKQNYQPTMQGAELGQTIYFHKVSDNRYGYPKKNYFWDSVNNYEVHEEVQQYQTTFQVDSWVKQDPNNVNTYTASDLVNYVSEILQSDYAIITLIQQNIGILRISEIRNPYFIDDYDQFEASASFDFTLTHLQTMTTINNPYVSKENVTGNLYTQ